jgi:hypothetical protein
MKTLVRHTRRAWALTFAVTVALAACGTDSPTEVSIFGTYTMHTVGGHALPRTQIEEGFSVTLVSGALVLRSDHTYTVTFNQTVTVGTQSVPQNESSSGTFSVSGSTITFVEDGATSAVGTIDGNTMTVTADGEVFVLKK